MQKKSHAQISEPCCLRNDHQRQDGPRRWVRCIYLATVLAETLNPSLASSAWILRWPQSRFSVVIRRIRVRSSGTIGRRPGRPVRHERRRQYVRQPWRCQRSTVSGFTTRREVCQPLNQRYAKIQKRRSTSSRRGRGLRRCRTTSCCRRQRLSAISSAFGWTAAASAHSKQRSICLSPVVEPPGG